jgi:CubicO group peptidase (beta-lactamase class C family)
MAPIHELGVTRRRALGVLGGGLAGVAAHSLGLVPAAGVAAQDDRYFPPPETAGGWRIGDARTLGINPDLLREAIRYHDESVLTTSHGGALIVIHRGHVVAERYTTGAQGPQPWSARTTNDIKSSTKSVFGTAVGVFLDQHRDITLDTPLVGDSASRSLIPPIWEQPLTDPRKSQILVKHALSMTSGHETREPWLAPSARLLTPGYRGPFQMYEYCFGWWQFEGIAGQRTLRFEPGAAFNYSNYGLEMLALAMRLRTGQEVGPWVYDRVLGPIGLPREIRDTQYREMPYADNRELNFSDEPGWGRGGSEGCNAYGADRSASPLGYNSIVGSTFRCSARDLARLAYLWLNRGRWGARQLVPAAWMTLATRRYVRDTGETPSNYGFTFWTHNGEAGVPSDLFMSRGHNLNHSYVIPSLDLVVARLGNDNRRSPDGTPFATTLIQKIVAAVDG